MAAFVVCALCALVILKPQEFVPALAGLPLLYILFALCTVVGVLEAIVGKIRLAVAPHLLLCAAFFGWGALVTLVKQPGAFAKAGLDLAIVLGIVASIALFAGSSRGLSRFSWTFLACALFATGVAIVQAGRPFGCMEASPDDWEGKGELVFDGRPCETSFECRKDAPNPDANYRCERVGPFGTATIGGRVRYRGKLADPNELSLAAVMALPLALALFERKRRLPTDPKEPETPIPGLPVLLTDRLLSRIGTFFRTIPALAIVGTVAFMIVLSKSRMGVLVFLIVMGIAFLRRMGAWGAVIGCIAFPPMLLLGGRSGAEAEASADERLELVAEALMMIRTSKGIGFGVGQFHGESSTGLTAHNSYLLAAAETGIIGICLFALMLWLALKVPLTLWFGSYDVDPNLRRLAPAVAIALAGAYVGIFFLSWSYKEILYMMLGASAALYQAARAQDRRFEVRFDVREAAICCALALGVLPAMYLVIRVLG
jgi:hypothetical protein